MAGRPKKADSSASRVFKTQATVHHDLYILEPAKMIKDTSVGKTGDPDFRVPVVHQHFFHTVDSSGRPMDTCSQIGGHFHDMEVIQKSDGNPPEVKCVSGPVQWARKKQGSKFLKVKVPVNHYDNHTHDVTYLQSEVVQRRQANVEAAKVQASQAAKESGQGVGSTEGLGSIAEG